MNSFKLNVAYLLGWMPKHYDLYEVEVFHFLGAVMEIKAKVCVWHNINSLDLITECQKALDNQLNQAV